MSFRVSMVTTCRKPGRSGLSLFLVVICAATNQRTFVDSGFHARWEFESMSVAAHQSNRAFGGTEVECKLEFSFNVESLSDS